MNNEFYNDFPGETSKVLFRAKIASHNIFFKSKRLKKSQNINVFGLLLIIDYLRLLPLLFKVKNSYYSTDFQKYKVRNPGVFKEFSGTVIFQVLENLNFYSRSCSSPDSITYTVM